MPVGGGPDVERKPFSFSFSFRGDEETRNGDEPQHLTISTQPPQTGDNVGSSSPSDGRGERDWKQLRDTCPVTHTQTSLVGRVLQGMLSRPSLPSTTLHGCVRIASDANSVKRSQVSGDEGKNVRASDTDLGFRRLDFPVRWLVRLSMIVQVLEDGAASQGKDAGEDHEGSLHELDLENAKHP